MSARRVLSLTAMSALVVLSLTAAGNVLIADFSFSFPTLFAGDVFSGWFWGDSTMMGAVVAVAMVIPTLVSMHLLGERAKAERRSEFLVHHDALTELPNRALLQDRIEIAIARAERGAHRLAVLLLDVDNFKDFNDGYEHAAGDALLKQISARLRRCLRGSDTVARFGDDSFAIVIQIDSAAKAAVVAELLLKEVARPVAHEGRHFQVSSTIGVTVYPDDSEEPNGLMRNCEIALYRGRAETPGTYHFYSQAMGAEARHRMALIHGLPRALKEQHFHLLFQPKVDLASGAIIGCEALLRWNHPERGLVPPAEFIPVAESNGLIHPIGQWVLDQVCLLLRGWPKTGLPEIPISINLSAVQFRDRDLTEKVVATIRRHGVAPSLLEFEITESAFVHDLTATIQAVRGLSAFGVRLSIDDFGTGYSSLSYLKLIPVNRLKIDKTFIIGLATNADDQSIVKAIVQLGHSLGLRVLAEGVETAMQKTILESLGCDEIQGFLVSKALPVEQFAAFLSAGGPMRQREGNLPP